MASLCRRRQLAPDDRTVGLTIGFGKSDNLASAYGIAVSLTMPMTSALLFIAMREIWGWSLLAAGGVAASS